MDHDYHGHECHCMTASRSVNQTLEELDFERGIWSAALNGEYERVEKLLNKGWDPNKRDKSGYSAMHYACRSNHKGVAKLLLEHGADVNITTRSGGATPLHRAAFMGHLDLTKFLLEKGANPALVDSDGRNVLHKAAEKGHVDICRLLLKANSYLSSVKDGKGFTASDLVPDKDDELKQLLSPK